MFLFDSSRQIRILHTVLLQFVIFTGSTHKFLVVSLPEFVTVWLVAFQEISSAGADETKLQKLQAMFPSAPGNVVRQALVSYVDPVICSNSGFWLSNFSDLQIPIEVVR